MRICSISFNSFQSLNHLLLRLISTLLKLEISKQTNAKADDSNSMLEKIMNEFKYFYKKLNPDSVDTEKYLTN